MYEWLSDALQGPSTVVTANRRLARVLHAEFARHQVERGLAAWTSPNIFSWQDWLTRIVQEASDQVGLPTRLSAHQSELLWERCLQKELGETRASIASLVRLSREAWQRLADWQVPIREVARTALSADQRFFAAAAGRYLGILERESWVDDAGLAQLALVLLSSGRSPTSGCVTFVGFDRPRPSVTAIRSALSDAGCDVRETPKANGAAAIGLQRFESVEAELRAAGAWARARLEEAPGQSIAIIAADLERQAASIAHLVREGFVPGWQYAPPSVARALNTSYGRRLSDYPAVSIALLLLTWLVRDLSSTEVGHLLRSPLLGSASLGGRSRLELRLRQLPDRRWTPAMVSSAFRGRDTGAGAAEWLRLVAHLTKARRDLKRRASPSEWAVYIDATLSVREWPGRETLSSFDFQLVNRWRDLLNDLARLALISPSMNLKSAIRRLELMAAQTVFQPESEHSKVQLMGPLEASGAEFDALWVSGVTAANWPPAGNPSPLLSRQLQRRVGMPDADPADTLDFANSLLRHLGGAAKQVVFSYARHADDAEQSASGLLASLDVREVAAGDDPGWHVSQLVTNGRIVKRPERIPAMRPDERIAGGAGTIQRQLSDPLSAFIVGRLGVPYLPTQAFGLPASLRGNIIHDALHQLYIETPSRQEIATWSEAQLQGRIDRAIDSAFTQHERNADDSLSQLLRLERARIADLLRRLVGVDVARDEFEIAAVEQKVSFSEADVRLRLRVDRIDRTGDGSITILDYKTGAKKTLLDSNGRPREVQLIAYAMALDEPIAALALVNVDAREISFDGAGTGFSEGGDWEASLDEWKDLVRAACRNLSAGDVRTPAIQGVQDARPLNLLSRYTELLRDA